MPRLLAAFDSQCAAVGCMYEMGAPWRYGEALAMCPLGSALARGFGQVGLESLWEQIQNGAGIALKRC